MVRPLSRGSHTIEMVTPFAGYQSRDDPKAPGQTSNPLNLHYGNPRRPDVPSSESSEVVGGVSFFYRTYVTVDATVRDKWTGARVANVPVRFDASSGMLTNIVIDKYQHDAFYSGSWFTTFDGKVADPLRAPTVDAHLFLTASGYQDYLFLDAISNAIAGTSKDLGALELIPLDINGNGIGDAWELAMFGPGTNVVAADDTDNDGVNNWGEYLGGTDPTNPNESMEAGHMETTNGLTLTWPVSDGRTYEVWTSDDLAFSNWMTSGGPWEAQPGQTNMTWTDTNDQMNVRYYRIDLLEP